MKKVLELTLRGLLILTALLIAPMTAAAQDGLTVEVTVVDELGPVIGASVFVDGTTIGDVTDADGVAVLKDVPKDATLIVSFIGYTTQTIKVNGRAKINVTMAVSSEFIEETVVVGYGVQKKESLTSAISQIASEDIQNTKQIDVVSSLQGKVPGLLINQNNSRPGDFNSTISLRGYGTPMIVVDGVVRSGQMTYRNNYGGAQLTSDMSALQELDANDIESISVLKDAAAAIYGLGAANGVILITTKKGKVQKPAVSFSANLSLQQPTSIQNKVDLEEYMRWKNGMLDVSRETAGYWSEQDIKDYVSGVKEWYDWYDNLTKSAAFTQQYNASVRGGNEGTQYYFGLGYADDATIYKTKGFSYDRYNFNGNVTSKITNNLEASFRTSLRITSTKQPGSYNDLDNLAYYLLMCDPTTKPYVKDNPNHFTSVEEHKNPAAILDVDYELSNRKNMSFNNTFDLTYTAPWLKGLKIQATGAYDFNLLYNTQKIHQWDEYDYLTDEWAGTGCGNTDDWHQQDAYSESWMYNTRLYGRLQANYGTHIGQHDIQAMVAAETTVQGRYNIKGSREYGPSASESFFTHPTLSSGTDAISNSGTRSSSATAGYLSRINYNYAGKYFAEVMGRYDGTYVYAPGKRWGFFPSYSLGWRLSEESFIKDNMPWLNNLKLRWSDGFTGMVQGSAYAYLAGYTTSDAWSFSDGKNTNGWVNNTVENTVLTWTNVRMEDIGLDWEINRGIFGGSFDWFRRVTSGIAATRSNTLPDFYGVSLPQENLNKSENMGLELQLYHRNSIGDFNYRVSASATYTRNRMLYQEADNTATYSSADNYWKNYSTGRWDGYMSQSMYHADGQYTSLAEISDADIMYHRILGNAAITPGQYKVEDRNGDGYITSDDVYYMFSSNNPPLQFGLQFSGNYKNFDFSLVFNGSALRWKTINMYGYSGTGFFSYMPSIYTDSYHVANYGDDPWDPNTQWVAGYYPALQASGGVYNTGFSDGTYSMNLPYNTVNAAFLRLKTVDMGYTVSPKFLKTAGIKSCRLSLNATNLLTFCDKRLKFSDPEQVDTSGGAGALPPNKAYTFGIRLNF